MDALQLRKVARVCLSIASVVVAGEVCRRVPHINQTAVALALLLVLELIAINVGFVEALLSAGAAALELVRYYVTAHGWHSVALVEWIAVITFLVVAVITIRLSHQARTGTIEAGRRAEEMSLLDKFGIEMLPAENSTATIEQGLSAAVNIFDIEGVAFRLFASGEIFRVGPAGSLVPDGALEQHGTESVVALRDKIVFVKVDGGDGPIGILGFYGAKVSREVLRVISHRLAMSLERAIALERATEVEAARRCAELGSAVLDALAHDIKTPLATMKVALASLLSVRNAVPPTHVSFLSMINEQVDRLSVVIHDVLNMGRLESGLFRLARAPQTVEMLVTSTVEEMSSTLARRPVGIHIPDGIPSIFADLYLMKQVLKQLLDNAIKYTPEGTPLSISSNQVNGMVTIEVADRGPGIPEIERQYIFEKYYRGQSSRDKTVGLGLGLAIAKRIVKAHGGNIWVSANEGCGSVFHLSVPTPELRA
jgi:two-component system, OmpR family, sensor histidine kinase KdpD